MTTKIEHKVCEEHKQLIKKQNDLSDGQIEIKSALDNIRSYFAVFLAIICASVGLIVHSNSNVSALMNNTRAEIKNSVNKNTEKIYKNSEIISEIKVYYKLTSDNVSQIKSELRDYHGK